MKPTLILTFFIVLFFSLSYVSYSQVGTIRGSLIKDSNGEKLIGASVTVEETQQTIYTDIDGSFEFNIKPGKYSLKCSYIGLQEMVISKIKVSANAITPISEIRLLESSVSKMSEVVIVANSARNTESAILTTKRKSISMIDGISAAKFRQTGDGTAAEAAKRVTGVTVQDGKYVYVRGLGDRYSKTMLNNVDIPGLDPDKNSIQMDIFPTALLDNLVVCKNFVAELPADFTGGLVNIETKEFPIKKIFDISVSIGYNPSMHFNPNYLTYNGGNTDFLGFDDGTRKLPAGGGSRNIPTPINFNYTTQDVTTFLHSFNPELEAKRQPSFMDYGFSISTGNQMSLKNKHKIGYIFSASYKTNYVYYDDVAYGEYQKSNSSDKYNFIYSTIQKGQYGQKNTTLGLMGGLAYKKRLSKYKFNIMHLQSGENRAGKFNIDNNPSAAGQSGFYAYSDNLEYNQRSLTNVLFQGKHVLKSRNLKIDWRISPTYSISNDPDIRKTAFTIEAGDTVFNAGAGGFPTRIWRSLNELNLVGKIDITKTFKLFNKESKLKFGFSQTFKNRNYEIIALTVQFFHQQSLTTSASEVLIPRNYYPNNPNGIYYQTSNTAFNNPNEYSSNILNTAFYLSNEFQIIDNLNSVLGLRAEYYVQKHTGRNQGASLSLDNQKVLDALDFFPTATFIYAINDNQNLRFGYSRTIARPSFKELSFAQIIDPLTNRIFNGSLLPQGNPTSTEYWAGNLTETRINNFDLRWEYFMYEGQLVSVSVFYKQFNNPIELVRIPVAQTSSEFQPRNVGNGQIYGVEIEFNKHLGFVTSSLKNIRISGNFTYLESRIDMTELEYNSRLAFEKTGETIKNHRQMAGQSPYTINGGIGYHNPNIGVNTGFYYNVQGPTLSIVGVGIYPDIFTEPFHSLNFTFQMKIGNDKQSSLDFKVSNILNDRRESHYRAYQAQKQIFSSINPGTEFSVGFSHRF